MNFNFFTIIQNKIWLKPKATTKHTDVDSLHISKRELAISADFDWSDVLEAALYQRFQSDGDGVAGVEHVVHLVASRTQRRI